MNFNANPTGKVATLLCREPAWWVSVIESGLTLLIVFDVLTQNTFGLILPVVQAAAGLYVAWVTKETLLTALTGFAKAFLSAIIIFGWSLTDAQTAAILAFVALVGGAFVRDRNYPLAYPPEPVPGSLPVTDVGAG